MRFADSHCHLTDSQFDGDRETVLERARSAGVARLIVIGANGDFSHNERAVALAHQHPDLFAIVGVHPHDARTITSETYGRLRALARQPKVVGLGETGLDFYYDHSPREDQRTHFRTFIRLARDLGLPLSLHVRGAYAEAIDILRTVGEGQVQGVMHCFTGTADDASALLDLGLFISFSGIVTFKNAQALRNVVRIVPRERLLIETDCPLLAPAPYRGKRNEPAHVVRVAETIAAVTNRPLADIAETTTRNTEQLFRLTA